MDKCSFYSAARYVKQLGARGRYLIFDYHILSIFLFDLFISERSRKKSPDLHSPGTVTQFTLLVGNGTVAPLFLVIRKPSIIDFELEECRVEYIKPTKKLSERRGEEAVVAFLEYHKMMKTFSPGDVLISDNEKAFDTELVKDLLEEMGILKLNFPIGLGHLTDPCDQEFHSEEKTRYYSILSGMDLSRMTLQAKCEAIHGAYYGGKEESIVHYFSRCGILGNREPNELAVKLLGEGIYPAPKFKDLHNQQIVEFNQWLLQKEESSDEI